MSAAFALLVVMWLSPARPNPQANANRAFAEAKRVEPPSQPQDAQAQGQYRQQVQEMVDAALPSGAYAVVGLPAVVPGSGVAAPGSSTQPDPQYGTSSNASPCTASSQWPCPPTTSPPESTRGPLAGQANGSRVRIISAGDEPNAAIRDLTADGRVAATAADADGIWVVVAEPASGSRLPSALGGALVALIGVAITGLVLVPTRPASPQSQPVGARAVPLPLPARTPEPSDHVEATTAALVRGVADLIPELPDESAWQASKILRDAGVSEVIPDGERYDPTSHHVVGLVATSDLALVDTVARTVQPGYVHRGQLIVHPRVALYSDHPEAQEPGDER
jgi:hypothetical protein